MDYQTIKREARAQGVRVTDLIALAPQNDPFYTGTPGELEKARWFTDLWRRFGYGRGVHLRRVHYQAVSQDPPILKTDSTLLDDLAGVDVDMPELPSPDLPPESDDLLYDSRRGYFGQLDFFKCYRNGEEH